MKNMAYARSTLSWFAQDVVEFTKKGCAASAKECWHELVGAATMYAVLTDDDPDPVQTYALPLLYEACETFGVDYDDVYECIRD